MATVGVASARVSKRTWFEANPACSVTETKDDDGECQSGEAECGCSPGGPRKKRAETTPLSNDAQLNCVSLHFQLDREVTYEAVKGQDERPLRGALDSPVRHHRTSMLTSKNKSRRVATSALTFVTFS